MQENEGSKVKYKLKLYNMCPFYSYLGYDYELLYLRHHRAQTQFKNCVFRLNIIKWKQHKKDLAWNLRGAATNRERPVMAQVR